MALVPLALSLLPIIPGLIRDVLKIVDVVRGDPMTPAEVKAQLDQIAVDLAAVVERVKAAPLPPRA